MGHGGFLDEMLTAGFQNPIRQETNLLAAGG